MPACEEVGDDGSVASFNLENLFARPRAFNLLTLSEGKPILDAFAEFNSLIALADYTPAVKNRMIELLPGVCRDAFGKEHASQNDAFWPPQDCCFRPEATQRTWIAKRQPSELARWGKIHVAVGGGSREKDAGDSISRSWQTARPSPRGDQVAMESVRAGISGGAGKK